MEQESPSPGLLATIRNMADTVLKLLQNRIELFATELQEEKLRALGLVAMFAAGILFGVLAVLILTLAIIWSFREHAVLLLWVFGCTYTVGAVLIFTSIRNRLKDGPAPFAGSVGELKKDREWLQPKN